MRTILIIATFGLLVSRCGAVGPTRCFDADSDKSFLTSEVIALGGSLDAKMPQVECDAQSKPIKLIWAPRPDNTSIDVQLIGRYQGKGIYCVTYRENSVVEGTSKPQLECLMLGYQEPASSYMGIRPFFVASSDDQTRWSSPLFTAEKAEPFALEVGRSFSGNGMYWENYVFVFTVNEAHIAKHQEGGRKMHTKTHRYSRDGEVIATEISGAE